MKGDIGIYKDSIVLPVGQSDNVYFAIRNRMEIPTYFELNILCDSEYLSVKHFNHTLEIPSNEVDLIKIQVTAENEITPGTYVCTSVFSYENRKYASGNFTVKVE